MQQSFKLKDKPRQLENFTTTSTEIINGKLQLCAIWKIMGISESYNSMATHDLAT